MTAPDPLCCDWCGVYIPDETPLVCWRTRGVLRRQQPRDPWNYYCRRLCPSCTKAARIRTSTWQVVSETEVRQRTVYRSTAFGDRDRDRDDRFVIRNRRVDPEQETPMRLRDSVLHLIAQAEAAEADELPPEDTT